MSNKRVWKLVLGSLLLLGVFLAAMERLMRDRLEQGDVYAEYSTFRSDPIGTKAFYDVLEATPGIEVSRYVRPLEQIDRLKPGTFFYLGDPAESWEISAPEKLYLALERWMRDGGRIVVTLKPERFTDSWSQQRREKQIRDSEERAKKEREEDSKKEKKEKEEEEIKYVDLPARWKIQVKRKDLPMDEENEPISDVARAADRNWPEMPWQSVLHFQFIEDSGWRTVVSRDGNIPVVVERSFEKGSLVLVSDSYLLTNEGLWLDRQPDFLSWLIGDNTRVYFDEAHLGSVEQHGVATLARRYGLFGAVYMLVLLALLFVWRNARSLAPAYPETAAGSSLGEESSLGLVNLLKRSVKPATVIPLCISEWMKTAATAKRSRQELESIWQEEKSSGKMPNVVHAYQQIQQLLRKRRMK